MIQALIDTGAVYALAQAADRHHQDAVVFLKNWVKRKGIFLLADLVFIESMTLIKRRLGSAAAIRVGIELRENPLFSWVSLDPELEEETWSLFQGYQDKEWSYTDCELLALSRRLKTADIFAFDHHFSQMSGIRCLPAL
jgi:predicted nucleic acid-binding protein